MTLMLWLTFRLEVLPIFPKEEVPVRFRRYTLLDITYNSYFTKLFPGDIVQYPKADDWGTAMCVK